MIESARWYVVNTYSGYENKVAQNIEKVVEKRKLHEYIQEIKIPTEPVIEVKDGKSREVERKTYPGYVLIKMIHNDETWYVVRNTRGVTGFVGPDNEPTPLSDEEVAKLGVTSTQPVLELEFAIDDTVQISGTAMDGFVGKVKSVNVEDQTAEIVVSMFGRDTTVNVALSDVRKYV